MRIRAWRPTIIFEILHGPQEWPRKDVFCRVSGQTKIRYKDENSVESREN